MYMHAKKTLSIASALLAAILTLAGCGGTSSPNGNGAAGTSAGASARTAHDKADTMFAQRMIPHHGQAIDMAKMAKSQAGSAQVKKLAADIQAAQGPEIARMTGWLRSWGAGVPSTGMAGMPGMAQGSHNGMPGMMSADDMHRLEKAHGTSFDRMFLQMMIKHHQGALQMAKAEQARGKSPWAVKLAGSIEASQTKEIAKMRQMLTA